MEKILGCSKGRSSAKWIDFDLFGHQIVAQLKPSTNSNKAHHTPRRRPSIRFNGEVGELATRFFLDPADNPSRVQDLCLHQPALRQITNSRASGLKSTKSNRNALEKSAKDQILSYISILVRQTLYYIVLVHLDSSGSEKRFLPVVTKGPVCRTDTKEPLCHLPSCPKPLAQHPSSP